MTSISRIPGSSHQQNDRERAQEFFEKGEYSKAFNLLERYSVDEMEVSTRFLMGKIELGLSNVFQAKLHFEAVYAVERKNKQVLRLLIETHHLLHEYQKVLFYLNHLFKLDGDVDGDIQNVLRLYRELGLYDRALELQDTMDQNNFFHIDYLEEKVLTTLEIENAELSSKILTTDKKFLRYKPSLNRALRRVQCGINYLGLRRRIYLKWGIILLGTCSDNGLDQDPIFESIQFGLAEIYETFLRFIDLCNVNHVKFSKLKCEDPEAETLCKALDLIINPSNHTEAFRTNSTKLPILHFHLVWKPEFRIQEGIHFSLSVTQKHLENADSLPDFIGIILKHEYSSNELIADSLTHNPQELYQQLYDRKHVSSLNFEARESMYQIQDLAFQKKSDVVISKLPSINKVPRRKPWDYRYFRESLQQDGLLYVKSLLQTYAQTRMPKSQIRELIAACQRWNYADLDTLKYCSLIEPDLTMSLVLQDMLTPELKFEIAHAVDHVDIIPALRENLANNHSDVLKSGIWVELIFEDSFSNWIKSRIKEPRSAQYLLKGFETLIDYQSFNPQWLIDLATVLDNEEDWGKWSSLADFLILQQSDWQNAVKKKLNRCNCLNASTLQLLLNLGCSPNESQKTWILSNLNSRTQDSTRAIQEFKLNDLLSQILKMQASVADKSLLIYSQLTAACFSTHCSSVADLLTKTNLNVQAELYSFLLYHSKDQYRLMDKLFLNTELKLIMRPHLTTLFEKTQDVSTEKDLLFLMEQDEAFRLATARMLVYQGDMEFYVYLVYRLSTHGNEFGLEIFSVLYECRCEQAIEMLIKLGVISKLLNQCTMIRLLEYIMASDSRMDEWQIFMRDDAHSHLRKTLKYWLEKNLNSAFTLLKIYLRTFPEAVDNQNYNRFLDPHKMNRAYLQLLYKLNPETAITIVDKLAPNNRTRYLMNKDWKRN